MKTLLLSILASTLAISSAYAASVRLINKTPQAGKMTVQYEFLSDANKSKTLETTLPSNISLPSEALGIRVISITNKLLPMPHHHFNFPTPACQWKKASGKPAEISFSIINHRLSCS